MPPAPDNPPLNPYEAPQTRDLPVAALAEAAAATESLVAPPREVQRWVKAALWLYWISFVVPYAPWIWAEKQDWHCGTGLFFCIFGMFAFWFPPLFSWWANAMFWIAYRDMNRVTAGTALGYAITAMVLAPVTGILELLYPVLRSDDGLMQALSVPIVTSAPYLCWLGSMVLMLIAALKLRRAVSRSTELEATHD
jgi:hypothetical protein